jgi:nitroreductase
MPESNEEAIRSSHDEATPPAVAPASTPASGDGSGARSHDSPARSHDSPARSAVPKGAGPKDTDPGVPVIDVPALDFWETLYGRRSIRRFSDEPVPRELIDQVIHAGIWAPSSCNYQMWDLVPVDDPAINARLTELSTQMGNAPVNVIVSYGSGYSTEHWAGIQSASALVQNMSLAAHALGLGSFWITQLGDADEVRRMVGLPPDRFVVAVLAVGFPKIVPKVGPKRRPLDAVRHWNHYGGRPIPSTADPEAWHEDDLSVYQRARVLNGLRHNKPRAWEMAAIDAALDRFIDDGREKPQTRGDHIGRWLEVLPCTGIVAEHTAQARPAFRFDVLERTPEVGQFVVQRLWTRGEFRQWPHAGGPELERGVYAHASCFFRLEGLPRAQRTELMQRLFDALEPGGDLVLGYVSSRSLHDAIEWIRNRGKGPKGVEYVLSPDPNIGPFASLGPHEAERLARAAGFEVAGRLARLVLPAKGELAFRTRNFGRAGALVRGLFNVLRPLENLPGLGRLLGRLQFVRLVKPKSAARTA